MKVEPAVTCNGQELLNGNSPGRLASQCPIPGFTLKIRGEF